MAATTGVIVTNKLCNVVMFVVMDALYLINIAVNIKQFFVWRNIRVTVIVFVFCVIANWELRATVKQQSVQKGQIICEHCTVYSTRQRWKAIIIDRRSI